MFNLKHWFTGLDFGAAETLANFRRSSLLALAAHKELELVLGENLSNIFWMLDSRKCRQQSSGMLDVHKRGLLKPMICEPPNSRVSRIRAFAGVQLSQRDSE